MPETDSRRRGAQRDDRRAGHRQGDGPTNRPQASGQPSIPSGIMNFTRMLVMFFGIEACVIVGLGIALALLKRVAPETFARHISAAVPKDMPLRCIDCNASSCVACNLLTQGRDGGIGTGEGNRLEAGAQTPASEKVTKADKLKVQPAHECPVR